MSDLSQGLDWFLDHSSEISTVVGVLSGDVEPRGIISETPRDGVAEGVDSAPGNNIVDRAADVITQGTDFFGQVKGLLGLGYPAEEPQPVSPISHEVSPTEPIPDTSSPPPMKIGGLSIPIIAIAAIGILFLFKK